VFIVTCFSWGCSLIKCMDIVACGFFLAAFGHQISPQSPFALQGGYPCRL
jgi:hypothetical protein